MNPDSKEKRMRRFAFHCTIAIALAAAISPAWSADKAGMSQAQADYQRERARCLRGESGQVVATCLKEAGAAFEEARHGGLGNVTSGDLASNATQRCNAQPPADREACVQRILGADRSSEGSVGGGGVLRSTETPAK
jgi:hypothetical protein